MTSSSCYPWRPPHWGCREKSTWEINSVLVPKDRPSVAVAGSSAHSEEPAWVWSPEPAAEAASRQWLWWEPAELCSILDRHHTKCPNQAEMLAQLAALLPNPHSSHCSKQHETQGASGKLLKWAGTLPCGVERKNKQTKKYKNTNSCWSLEWITNSKSPVPQQTRLLLRPSPPPAVLPGSRRKHNYT